MDILSELVFMQFRLEEVEIELEERKRDIDDRKLDILSDIISAFEDTAYEPSERGAGLAFECGTDEVQEILEHHKASISGNLEDFLHEVDCFLAGHSYDYDGFGVTVNCKTCDLNLLLRTANEDFGLSINDEPIKNEEHDYDYLHGV